MVNIPQGTVRYHLQYLKRRKLIIEEYENGYTRFFITDKLGIESKRIISLLRIKTCKHIVLYLLFGHAVTKKRLVRELDEKPCVIDYYLKRLEKEGVIERGIPKNGVIKVNHGEVQFVEYNNDSKDIVYILADYPLLNDFFISNRNWFFDKITREIIKISINCEKRTWPRKMKSYDSRTEYQIEVFNEIFFDIFPHPYHV
jgi:hypothetical protein